MIGITLRNVTGSALTYNQMDENFRFLSQSYFYLSGSNTGNASFTGSLILSGSTTFSGSTRVDTSVGSFIVTDNVSNLDPSFIVTSTAIGLFGTSILNGITQVTGSLNVSGSTIITGSLNVNGGITGSLLGTASNATNAANATSASYAATASYSTTLIAGASNSDVGQLRFLNSANTSIVTINNLTASLAATASSVIPLNQNVIITGSLTVSASNAFTNTGNARFIGDTTFTGTNTITGSLNVSGSTTQIGNNSLTGITNLTGSVNISGSTSFIGTHTLSGSNTITGNTVLSGSIIVSGSTTFRNTTFIVTGSQFYTGSSIYIGNQTITGSLSLTSNGSGTGLFINGQKQFNYLSAYHTASILPTQNVSGSFIYSTLVTSSGITIADNSRITFANTGIYNIQFSSQTFTQTGATVHIWLKRNGTNISDSAGRIGPTSNNEHLISAWNFVDTFTSGSYVEIAYQSDQTNTQFQYIAATGNIPAIPSIIVTVTQVA